MVNTKRTTCLRRWLWWFLVLLPVWWYSSCAYDRYVFTREIARARAIGIMEDMCHRQCATYGIQFEELRGPIEAPINSDEHGKNFEFTWHAPNGTELLIIVWDNGLFVSSDHWWQNTPEDEQWAERQKSRSANPPRK